MPKAPHPRSLDLDQSPSDAAEPGDEADGRDPASGEGGAIPVSPSPDDVSRDD